MSRDIYFSSAFVVQLLGLARTLLTASAALGMDFEQRAHRFLRSGARHAALGGNAEFRDVAARRGDPRFGARGAVPGVNNAEEQRGAVGQFEIAKRPVEGVVAAIHRNRHVNVSELVWN